MWAFTAQRLGEIGDSLGESGSSRLGYRLIPNFGVRIQFGSVAVTIAVAVAICGRERSILLGTPNIPPLLKKPSGRILALDGLEEVVQPGNLLLTEFLSIIHRLDGVKNDGTLGAKPLRHGSIKIEHLTGQRWKDSILTEEVVVHHLRRCCRKQLCRFGIVVDNVLTALVGSLHGCKQKLPLVGG